MGRTLARVDYLGCQLAERRIELIDKDIQGNITTGEHMFRTGRTATEKRLLIRDRLPRQNRSKVNDAYTNSLEMTRQREGS